MIHFVKPGAEVTTLRDCPPGLFWFDGHLCFKSEYHTMVGGVAQTDAYAVESGEYFWGGTNGDRAAREALKVLPAQWAESQHHKEQAETIRRYQRKYGAVPQSWDTGEPLCWIPDITRWFFHLDWQRPQLTFEVRCP